MTSYRRDVLNAIALEPDASAHAGLWLDKFLEGDDKGSQDKKGAKDRLVREVTGIPTPEKYERFFPRWEKLLAELGAECHRFRVIGRLVVNLGAESVLETSIALHRTYGVPYIPGSALKGLAAHYVKTYFKDDPAWWANDRELFRILFGDTSSAGYVTFYDALYAPDEHRKHPLKPDVITVHHPDYYQGTKPEYYSEEIKLAPPADWDSPTPIPFITATGEYLIALSGPAEWVKAAFEILELALEREGVGAKTNSGYGRMRLAEDGKVHFIKSFDSVPKLNDTFKGEVFDVQENALYLLIPGLDGDEVYAYLPLDQPGKFKEGEKVNCQVIEIKKGKNDTRVICRRVKQMHEKA
ncbi:MAG: type III-B CRISPR module RAMP protein Cmr6 [Chloroflexota bacterium]